MVDRTKYNGPNGPHPQYGNALSGRPITVQGIIFRPYQRGIGLYARVSDDFRMEVWRPYHSTTYRAWAAGIGLTKKFRSEQRAFEAAIAQCKTVPA